MNFVMALELITRIKYKDSCKIVAYVNVEAIRMYLRITACITVKDPKTRQDLQIENSLQFRLEELDNMTQVELIASIFQLIIGLEQHDAEEWFYFNGKQYFPTHE